MSHEHRSIPVGPGPGPPDPAAGPEAAPARGEPKRYRTPLIDIHEGPDGLVLEADLPGATEEHVRVQLEDNVLTLHVSAPSNAPEGARLLHEEYQAADFYRSFILSDEVERSKIAADLKHGVLRLTLPRAERARSRRIEIKS